MLSNIQKECCNQLIQSCFEFQNRNGRVISTPFEQLPAPSKTTYYEKVANPIALKTVLDRLNQGAYHHLKELYCDWKLVFSNYSQCVTRSGRDWQDSLRMDQYVDELWEQKAIEGVLPPLEDLFPNSTHPRLDPASRKSSTIEAHSANASYKRSRSQSTISSGSAEESQTPNISLNASNQITRNQNKRIRKSTSTALNPPLEDEAQLSQSSKDRTSDPDSGWMRDSDSHMNIQALGTFILTRLKNERLPVINSSSYSIMNPMQSALSDTTIAQDSPALNLALIESRLNQNIYSSLAAFDQDLHKALLEAEKAYSQNPERLAGIYVLKRLYQELTQGDGTIALRDSIPVGGAKKLSSVAMGPGNPTQLPRNDDSVKLKAKDKILLDGVRHKGDYFRIGDWVHLFNPDHPSKPIIAQIFNTYRRVDTGRRMVSVCWYYRPEETVHFISRTFIVDEVFKTGNFIEHVVEDIIGRCLVLFYTRYLRGRPTAPLWTPGMPTYVCEHRYKDDVFSFKKIKNWDSCVPSNTRNESTDENFQFFSAAQLVSSLIRVPSPFLSPTANKFTGSGEPIVASPEEVKKELPKDQMKFYDFDLTLNDIKKVLGKLPTSPPRRPYGINDPALEQPNSQHSPNLPSPTLNPPPPNFTALSPSNPTLPSFSNRPPSSISNPTSPFIGNPAPSPIVHPTRSTIGIPTPSSIGNPPSSSIGNPANLLSVLSQYNHSRATNSLPTNFDPILLSLPTNRKLCLVDLLAGLDQFEKLPPKIFDTLLETSVPSAESRSGSISNETREDQEGINTNEEDTMSKKNKDDIKNQDSKRGEMLWFPCLPPSSSMSSRSRSWSGSGIDDHHSIKKHKQHKNRVDSGKSTSSDLGKLSHSQAYLDWLNQSKTSII